MKKLLSPTERMWGEKEVTQTYREVQWNFSSGYATLAADGSVVYNAEGIFFFIKQNLSGPFLPLNLHLCLILEGRSFINMSLYIFFVAELYNKRVFNVARAVQYVNYHWRVTVMVLLSWGFTLLSLPKHNFLASLIMALQQ